MRLQTNVSAPPSNFVRVWPGCLPALEVGTNDPVWHIQEGNGAGPGGTGTHRYQILYLPMGDVIMAFWTDLGPASKYTLEIDETTYPTPPYQQIVLGEHTVAECIHMADQYRDDADFAAQLLHTQVNESTLFEDYRRMIENDLELVKNRSVFGPHVQTQRNDYSAAGIREKMYKEQNNGQ